MVRRKSASDALNSDILDVHGNQDLFVRLAAARSTSKSQPHNKLLYFSSNLAASWVEPLADELLILYWICGISSTAATSIVDGSHVMNRKKAGAWDLFCEAGNGRRSMKMQVYLASVE